ncbi:MAG: hypothetical protein ACKOWK_00390 [Micrococcales bacterium]
MNIFEILFFNAVWTCLAFFVGGQISHLVNRPEIYNKLLISNPSFYNRQVWFFGPLLSILFPAIETVLFLIGGQASPFWLVLIWLLLVAAFVGGWKLSAASAKFGEIANKVSFAMESIRSGL